MPNSVKDLEDVVKTWAWSAYMKTQNGDLLSYNNAQVDVVWDKVRFSSEQPKFSNIRSSNDPQSIVIFSSTFDNESRQFQHHSFQTQRTTTATATTKLSKGFTRGVKTDIKLPVPSQVLKATAGFGNYVTIDCEEENTVEHALTWSVNTTVKAPKGLRTIANLEIFEQQFECNFKMNVSFRGNVMVKISNPVSGRVLMVVQNDIATVLRDLRKTTPFPGCVDTAGKTVVWPIVGSVRFNYGVSQRVRVREEDL